MLSNWGRKKQCALFGLLATLLMVGLTLLSPNTMQRVESSLLDLRFSLRGSLDHDRKVVIINIDDASLIEIGKWPWDRAIYSEMIKILNEAGAKVIAFDIFFRSDANKPLDAGTLKLVEAVKTAGNVILPIYFNLNEDDRSFAKVDPSVKRFAYNNISNTERLTEFNVIEAVDLFAPPPELVAAALSGGHINLFSDPDGMTRREILALRYEDTFYPAMSIRIAQAWLGNPTLKLAIGEGMEFGTHNLMVMPEFIEDARLWGLGTVNYRGGYRSFDYLSAMNVMKERFPADFFRDKIVLVGATSAGLYDALAMPYAPIYPGVEKIANVVDCILDNDFIQPLPILVTAFLCAILGLFLIVLLPRYSMVVQLAISSATTLVILLVAYYLFTWQSIWLVVTTPIVTVWLVTIILSIVIYLQTRREQVTIQKDGQIAVRSLALSYQEKGLLEMAYNTCAELPLDRATLSLFMELAKGLEQKRKTATAITIYKRVYEHDHNYMDVAQRLEGLGVGILKPARAKKRKRSDGDSGITYFEHNQDAESVLELKPGQTLGRYEVEKVLGKGNMGIVYLAKDPTIDRMVALKTVQFIDDDDDKVEEMKLSFLREAKMAGKLNHPNIVTVFDAGEDWDLSYFAMEVLDGYELKDYISQGKSLAPAKAVQLTIRIALALDYAHQQGVIHRDIKPANIMLLKGGSFKIADFGTALIRGEVSITAGTPSYMAPEQISNSNMDGRTDLYALGVVLFELLSGRKPFTAPDLDTMWQTIINKPAPHLKDVMPGINQELSDIVAKLLEKSPDNRYPTGKALAIALHKFIKKKQPIVAKGTGNKQPRQQVVTPAPTNDRNDATIAVPENDGTIEL